MVAAITLVESGAVQSILNASYVGVLVDEYQDCTVAHHGLVCALSGHLPCYVFGDPLQAIFGFRPSMLANRHTDILAVFPQAGVLDTPQRWIRAGNAAPWCVAHRPAGKFPSRHLRFPRRTDLPNMAGLHPKARRHPTPTQTLVVKKPGLPRTCICQTMPTRVVHRDSEAIHDRHGLNRSPLPPSIRLKRPVHSTSLYASGTLRRLGHRWWTSQLSARRGTLRNT
ncbi:UvrD-helicase domain-containing protein [Burkholderia ubonensis]|uniref:UvrD-helicase domain-containing protein n=1 Tax=Burkholderia ubonensis TaxID=101571 RepID=UPI000F5B6C36|nr:hypothetical protein DF013_17560 [Burkholderia ubonensis]